MASTNSTSNYGFPQWVGTDKPSFLNDFNPAFSSIDNLIKTVTDAAAAAATAAAAAQTTADNAATAAATAQTTADNAATAAATAQTTADNAATAAAAAQTTADNAATAAANAASAASEAITFFNLLGITDSNTATDFKEKVDNAVPQNDILASYFDPAV